MRIDRDKYLQQLIHRIDNGLIKVITGLRRVGKSYLLMEIFHDYLLGSGVTLDKIIKFDFNSAEDLKRIGEDYLELKKRKKKVDPNKFIDYVAKMTEADGTYFLLLDEVQELDAFEWVLNGFISQKRFDIFVTGSNAKFLSKDIVTEFRGRGDEIHVLPCSFSECWKNYDEDPRIALNQYLVYGGLPLVVLSKTDEDRRKYLDTQIQETYLADIIDRYKIRNSADLKELLAFLASSVSSFISPRKLSLRFKSMKQSDISEPTIDQYIEYFDDIFLLKKAFRYDIKGNRYISTPYKIYFEDIGVRNAILSFRQVEKTHLMENAIYNELRYRGFNVDVGQVEVRDIFLDPNTNKKKETQAFLEADFVANEGNERIYIQSAYSIDDPAKKENELRSLKAIEDSFKKIVIINDNLLDGYDENGIYYLDFYRFLANGDSLLL